MPFLGEIPIDPRVAECGDQGDPIVHKYPDSAIAKSLLGPGHHRQPGTGQDRPTTGVARAGFVKQLPKPRFIVSRSR